MRKSVIMIIAAVLLMAAVLPGGFMQVGLSVVHREASEPEYEIESEPESEPEDEAEPESESEPEAEPESESEPEAEPETEPEADSAGMPQGAGSQDFIPEDDAVESPVEHSEAELSEAAADEENEDEAETPSSSEELVVDERATEYLVLSPHEAVVETYSELKSALGDNNGITTVYFGANITMQAGIRVSPQKSGVEIVGLNPLEPDRDEPYTLTDMDSATFTDTIYVGEAGTGSLHIRDLAIVGKNYYGPFSIADIAGLNGFVITYERVSYDGPQLCHNRRGTARFIDSSARIHGGNGVLSPRQEFSEAKHLIFEGECSIDTETSAYSIFWHPLGGTFRLADDSSLALTSPNTSAVFGVFYADGAAYKLDINLGSRSVLDATISGFVSSELYVGISGLTVSEGGEFRLTTTKAATATVLRVDGELLVDKDAIFLIYGAGGATRNVLRQQNGDILVRKGAVFRIIAQEAYASLLNLAGSGFICDDPSSVLLYNAGRDIVASISPGRMFVSAQQINHWRSTVPDGLDFPPLYGWRKADKSNFVLNANLAIGANANFSSVTSNYSAGDPPGLPPNATTLSMSSSRILAFGRLELIASRPTVKSRSIEGVSAAGALIRASFTQGGIDYTLPDVETDSDGVFKLQTDVELEAGTVISLKSSWQYLTAEAEVTVREKGSLGLFSPDVLEFHTSPLSPFHQTLKRVNPQWKLVVSDARGTGGKWSVYARLEREMLAESPYIPALGGALVFIDDSGKSSALSTDTDILIHQHIQPEGEEVFPIVWDESKGLLLNIRPGIAFADTQYSAVICWTVVDGV